MMTAGCEVLIRIETGAAGREQHNIAGLRDTGSRVNRFRQISAAGDRHRYVSG